MVVADRRRRYDRYFIILKQEIQGYGYDQREPTGYCKLEVRDGRGRVHTTVKGLKELSDGSVYKLYLLAEWKEKIIGVPAGCIGIDQYGKGEIKWEFDPDRVGGSDIPIERFHMMAVMVKHEKDTGREIIAPLVGYRENEMVWRYKFEEYNRENLEVTERNPENHTDTEKENGFLPISIPPVQQQEEVLEETRSDTIEADEVKASIQAEKDTEADEVYGTQKDFYSHLGEEEILPQTAEEKTEMKIEAEIKTETKTETQADFIPATAKVIHSIEDLTEDEPREDAHHAFQDIVKKFYDEFYTTEQFTYNVPSGLPQMQQVETPKGQEKAAEEYEFLSAEDWNDLEHRAGSVVEAAEDILVYMFRSNSAMSPFENQDENIEWIRISLKELSATSLSVWKYTTAPLVVSAYKKYKHLLLGMYKRKSIKRYVLGIPGVFEPAYKMRAAQMGFAQFECCQDKKPEAGDYGYWILEL